MKYALAILTVILLVYLVVAFNGRMWELNRLRSEEATVQAKFDSRQATKAALEAEIAYATSDAAVAQWAYENHMAKPGDISVVPIPRGQPTPTPTPQPVAQTTQVAYYRQWLALFFDPLP